MRDSTLTIFILICLPIGWLLRGDRPYTSGGIVGLVVIIAAMFWLDAAYRGKK